MDFDFSLDQVPYNPVANGVTRLRFVMTFSNDFKNVSGKFSGKNFTIGQDPLDPGQAPTSTFKATFVGKKLTVQVD